MRGTCCLTLKLEGPTFVGALSSYFGGYLYLILKQPTVGWIQLKQPVQVLTITNCCYKNIWQSSVWGAHFAWDVAFFEERCSWYSQIREAHIWVGTCLHILEVNYIVNIYGLLLVRYSSRNQFWLLQSPSLIFFKLYIKSLKSKLYILYTA